MPLNIRTILTAATLCLPFRSTALGGERDTFKSLRENAVSVQAIMDEAGKAIFDCRCSADEFEERECRAAQPASLLKLSRGILAVTSVSSEQVILGTYDFERQRFPVKVEAALSDERWVPCALRDSETGQPESDHGASDRRSVIEVELAGPAWLGFLQVDEARAKSMRTGGVPLAGEMVFTVDRLDKKPLDGDLETRGTVRGTITAFRLWAGARETGRGEVVFTYLAEAAPAAGISPETGTEGRGAGPNKTMDGDPMTLSMAQEQFRRGKAALENRELVHAVQAFRRCIELSPSLAECHRGLGSTLARQGLPEAGAEAYRAYLRLAPDAPDSGKIRAVLREYDAQKRR